MTTPTTIHDDRLALIVDGKVYIEDFEARIVCAELLARRAAWRQREDGMRIVRQLRRETIELCDLIEQLPDVPKEIRKALRLLRERQT